MAYRVTPHTKTKVPKTEVMFNRKIRYTIASVDDNLFKKIYHKLFTNIYTRHRTKQQKQEILPGVVKTKNHNKEKMIIKI